MDGSTRLAVYKNQIKLTFSNVTNKNRHWTTSVPGREIQYFHSASDGMYKMEALLECDTRRMFTLCSDRHYTTRSRWDTRAKEMGTILQHYETQDGNIYTLSNDIIMWIRDPTIVMYTSLTTQTCIWVKPVDKKCFLVVISNEKICIDPLLYRNVARDSSLFLNTYNPWKCEICKKMVPAHELYCRRCEKERYTRCSDMECYEPQMEGATQCSKCGIKLLVN